MPTKGVTDSANFTPPAELQLPIEQETIGITVDILPALPVVESITDDSSLEDSRMRFSKTRGSVAGFMLLANTLPAPIDSSGDYQATTTSGQLYRAASTSQTPSFNPELSEGQKRELSLLAKKEHTTISRLVKSYGVGERPDLDVVFPEETRQRQESARIKSLVDLTLKSKVLPSYRQL